MNIKRVVGSLLLAAGLSLSLTACGYEAGEIVTVEVENGPGGVQFKELEVSEDGGFDSEEELIEVSVDINSPCDEGDIYPACERG